MEGFIDPLTPRGISDWMFFVIPILLTGWTEKDMTISVTLASSILTVIGFIFSPASGPAPQNRLYYGIINRTIGIVVFWATAALVIVRRNTLEKLRRAHREIEEQAEKLLEAERLKVQFLGDSSHELRTPLAVVRSWIDLALRKKSKSLIDPHRALKKIEVEVEYIAKIIANLTTLARVDPASRRTLTLSTFSVNDLVQMVIRKNRILGKDMDIQTECPPHITYHGDKEKIEEVVTNLFTNAIRYGKKGGRVKITVLGDPRSITLAVEDDGIGISEKDLPYIFDRFYRVEKTRTSEGVGLGLSICKSIVEAHRGTITVASRENEGSTFTVTLPVAGSFH